MRLQDVGPNLVLLASVLSSPMFSLAGLAQGNAGSIAAQGEAKDPKALTIHEYLETDQALSTALLHYAATGDKATFRTAVEHMADAGDPGATLLLGELYIPPQCTFEWNKDFPHCDSGQQPASPGPAPQNPLGLPPSYEEAAHWLERASAAGVGEGSEVLAELITRMLANGHATAYTDADSTRLHALARAQHYDLEPMQVTCYRLTPRDAPALTVEGEEGLHHGPHPEPGAGFAPLDPMGGAELTLLREHDVHGTLHFGGGNGGGGTVLLERPEGPTVHIRLIYDHAPDHDFEFPVPAHRDVLYVQHGNEFLQLPDGLPVLPGKVTVGPGVANGPTAISIGIQSLDDGTTGMTCSLR